MAQWLFGKGGRISQKIHLLLDRGVTTGKQEARTPGWRSHFEQMISLKTVANFSGWLSHVSERNKISDGKYLKFASCAAAEICQGPYKRGKAY